MENNKLKIVDRKDRRDRKKGQRKVEDDFFKFIQHFITHIH